MTTENFGLVKPIDKTTVNQICSGQVVLNLATAVKELLENSIDAGATSIQIKLQEYGSDLIEVIDNGCGVEEINFQALTLKHHTSKITHFLDLYSVETFGFRGEALSSLCSLSDVTIITRHKNANIGTALKFDHNGLIVSNIKTSRKIGTTVKLENLFNTLPIRRTEFLKNLRREFNKMCNILYAYGLLTTGVRFTCTNHIFKSKITNKEVQEDKARKSTVIKIVDTNGESVESNIMSIFGVKQKQNLLEIKDKLPTPETLAEFGLENKILDFKKFKLHGYISSCAHGCGRSGSDRQFYYVNSRPVDNIKVSKLVNDVYHQYNIRQDPFVILNIKVSAGSFDMNVTPDKRQILLQDEKLLLAVIKESLYTLFRDIPSTLEIQNIGLIKATQESSKTSELPETLEKLKSNLKNAPKRDDIKGKLQSRVDNLPKCRVHISEEQNFKSTNKQLQFLTKFRRKPEEFIIHPNNDIATNPFQQKNDECKSSNFREVQSTEDLVTTSSCKNHVILENKVLESVKKNQTYENQPTEIDFAHEAKHSTENIVGKRKFFEEYFINKKISFAIASKEKLNESEIKRMKLDGGLTEKEKSKRKCLNCDISFEDIKKRLLKYLSFDNDEQKKNDIKFLTEINPQNNEKAENELKREITKDKFTQMEIIGQFNLGFIITKLDSDIFIIDQHASDEKYNFEILKSTTKIQTQKLFNPEKLELTVNKEELLLEHKEIFKKNGFEFIFDESGAPTKRISLTTIPFSKNIIFGKDDIDELLFYLENAPEVKNIRPSRMNNMYASRACRKSVMIGSPLDHNEMKKIVNHMGDIEHPWNCPHGRPTMRHLINLNMIQIGE